MREVVLFLSGDGGWQLDTDRMARVLQQDGALVLGIDEPALLASFAAEKSQCFFPDGDLENLSHYVQAYYRLPTYITPVLGGYSAGATLAYATAAQAPPGLFAGVLTLGFTPEYETTKPFCKGAGRAFHAARGWQGPVAAAGPEVRAALGRCPWQRRYGLPGRGCRRLHPQDPQRADFADPGRAARFRQPHQWSAAAELRRWRR